MRNIYNFVIPGKLPGINDWVKAQNSNRYRGNELKKQAQQRAAAAMYFQLPPGTHITKKVRIRYRWYEPNKKRDLDNVSGFGHKVIQDALTQMHIIDNDGWANIIGFSDDFFVDSQNPRIEVELEEVE